MASIRDQRVIIKARHRSNSTDDIAWSALYSTRSYPFEKPTSGKLAVKVINHYGDEVLKVYDVGK